MDFPSALTTLHEKAIYIQNGEQYHVERLDYDDRKAYVHRVDSDYYTDAISYTKITALETFESSGFGEDETRNSKLETRSSKLETGTDSAAESFEVSGLVSNESRHSRPGGRKPKFEIDADPESELRSPGSETVGDREFRISNFEFRPSRNHGEVHVNTQVVGFKKIKFHTHENVGAGNLTLPEQEMHTTAWWLTLPHEMLETLPYSATDRQDGVRALGNALQAMAILLVMCDGRDLGVAVGENSRSQKLKAGSQEPGVGSQESGVGGPESEVSRQEARARSQQSEVRSQEPEARSQPGRAWNSAGSSTSGDTQISNFKSLSSGTTNPEPGTASFERVSNIEFHSSRGEKVASEPSGAGQRTKDNGPRTAFEPNIYLYDKYPGGIGLSEPLYRMSERLLGNARKLIENCPCEAGCPSCVGPVGEIGKKGKEVALVILHSIGSAA